MRKYREEAVWAPATGMPAAMGLADRRRSSRRKARQNAGPGRVDEMERQQARRAAIKGQSRSGQGARVAQRHDAGSMPATLPDAQLHGLFAIDWPKPN